MQKETKAAILAAAGGTVERRDAGQYRGRVWVTRARLWVDRVASAWLIRTRIDDYVELAEQFST